MPELISKFWEQPSPGRAVLLGKGPSLDRYAEDEWRYAREVVIGINEAGQALRCSFGIHVDDYFDRCDYSDTIPLRPERYAEAHDGRGYTWDRKRDLGLWVPKWTACQALAILGHWGVRDILMVGFDSIQFDKPVDDTARYAKCIEPIVVNKKALRPRPPNMHKNYGMFMVAGRYELKLRWFHMGKNFNRLTVRMSPRKKKRLLAMRQSVSSQNKS
jgi:hypothetical protein